MGFSQGSPGRVAGSASDISCEAPEHAGPGVPSQAI